MQIFIKCLLLTICLTEVVLAGKEILFSVVTLDQVTKGVIEKNNSKVLAAKTEVINGKRIHVIKVLSSNGRVQYLKIDAETGKNSK